MKINSTALSLVIGKRQSGIRGAGIEGVRNRMISLINGKTPRRLLLFAEVFYRRQKRKDDLKNRRHADINSRVHV